MINDWTDCLPHIGFLFAALIPMKTLRRDQWSLWKPNCSGCFSTLRSVWRPAFFMTSKLHVWWDYIHFTNLVNPDKTKKCCINPTTSTIRIQPSCLLNQLKLGTSAPMRPRATKSKAYSWWSMHGSILTHVDPPNNGQTLMAQCKKERWGLSKYHYQL